MPRFIKYEHLHQAFSTFIAHKYCESGRSSLAGARNSQAVDPSLTSWCGLGNPHENSLLCLRFVRRRRSALLCHRLRRTGSKPWMIKLLSQLAAGKFAARNQNCRDDPRRNLGNADTTRLPGGQINLDCFCCRGCHGGSRSFSEIQLAPVPRTKTKLRFVDSLG